jgi:predicted HTH transcriptional regulator
MPGDDDDLFGWSRSHYPEDPGFKEDQTSREAAEDIKARAVILRAQCYKFIHLNPGHTADEIAEALNESPLAIRPRISELRTTKLITNHGRGINKSGMTAHRWVTRRYYLERLGDNPIPG